MTIQELNTLHHICDLERIQLLTITAMSVQGPQFAGYLLCGGCSNFLYVEGFTAWLYDCPDFPSPLGQADIYFDRIPVYHQDILLYTNPIAKQTFNYATPISSEKKCHSNRS